MPVTNRVAADTRTLKGSPAPENRSTSLPLAAAPRTRAMASQMKAKDVPGPENIRIAAK